MERFGKSSAPLLDARGHLLTLAANDKLVARAQQIYACYRRQPRRVRCKVCASALGSDAIFEKFGIPYFVCGTCGHLNGGFEDTAAFSAFLFTGDGGSDTAAHYGEATREAFNQRINDIYVPKARFLFDVLTEAGEDPTRLSHVDLGAGSGYFVAALRQAGAGTPIGYDVSQQQAELGNRMMGEPLLRLHEMDELMELAATVEADVVSMIFTLEHLEQPRGLMSALRDNSRVRYILVAVPTISPTMFLELAFPTVFERQLSAHTHLFSDASLRWLAEATGFARIGEWWFGSDAMDLYRAIAVRLRQSGQSDTAVGLWTQMMRPLIDDCQLAIDRRKLSSAVHLVLRRKT